jgi:hypothetical protein
MIDLHAHTTESDGTLSPAELVNLAEVVGLEALAVTDHDTLSGFDQARPFALEMGLDLVCGIEMSTRYEGRSVHLLGYFLEGDPGVDFRHWILGLQQSRLARNRELLAKLQTKGVTIAWDELERTGGPLPGRPHIARLMVEHGFVDSIRVAFDEFLDESACCYVARDEAPFANAIDRIRMAGGISSLPHPGRVSRDSAEICEIAKGMKAMGLMAIEVFHSDHSPAEVSYYANLAEQLGLGISGGTDFHGATKPEIELGTGRSGNVCVAFSTLEKLRLLHEARLTNNR